MTKEVSESASGNLAAGRNLPRFDIEEGQDYKAFRRFVNASRDWLIKEGYERLHGEYCQVAGENGGEPADLSGAMDIFRAMPSFANYAWLFRNIQQFKYGHADWGIQSVTAAQAGRLIPEFESIAQAGVQSGDLRLDPDVAVPDYFALSDFHQHPGGVAGNPLSGLEYELARRTRTSARNYANQLYRSIFSYLPDDHEYQVVLDWGTSFGAGLRTWMIDHPDSDGHGVDISAPCLKLAYARASEAGVRATWWQQDLESMSFSDDTFDMAFFAFMLHELPANRTEALLREACRVLKPGGDFIGMELVYVPGSPFQNALLDVEGWLNDEPFMPANYKLDYDELARKAGFSEVYIERFKEMSDGVLPKDQKIPPRHMWNIFRFRK